MSNRPSEILASVACDVFEQFAFMFGEQADREDLIPFEDNHVQVEMRFSGPFSGRLCLTASPEMCIELAANMLGMEPDEVERPEEALKEILNVICGNLLTALAGAEPVFGLTIPEATTVEGHMLESLVDDPDTVGLSIDDYPVFISFIRIEN